MRISWTDLAVDDLEHIEAYVAKESSPTVAIDLVLKIVDSIELILADHPNAGRTGRVAGTRELVIDGVPFITVYRQVGIRELQVLRVLHDSQQWPSGARP